MSAIIILPGRPTSDPQIVQAKNGSTTYTTLDIACPQRGQDGKTETVFYSCYFNSFLADRLIKAGVKKGTGLIIQGDLELHPFIHQKGKNQGHPNAGPSVNVKDWQFAPSTKTDDSGANPGGPGGMPQNGNGVIRPLDRKMVISSPVRCRAAAILLPEGSPRTATSRRSQTVTASRVPETTTASHSRMDISSRIPWQDRAPRRSRTTDICLQTEPPAVCRAEIRETVLPMCRNNRQGSFPLPHKKN